MSTWPKHVDPLDRAILDLLCDAPLRWQPHDPDKLSATEQMAIRLMVKAGLIDLRYELLASMTGQPERVEMILVVSGEYKTSDVWRIILGFVPRWVNETGAVRGSGSLFVQSGDFRLSNQGELARHHYQHQTADNPSTVCAFVRRLGINAKRGDVPAHLVVKSCRVTDRDETESSRASTAATTATAGAAAQATASVGDIAVHNHIQLDQGAIVQAVLAKIADQKKPAWPEPPPSPVVLEAPAPKPASAWEDAITKIEDDSLWGVPEPDPHDERAVIWEGKRLYLGRDTQVYRLFWLLFEHLGKPCPFEDVQRAVDQMETSEAFDHTPEQVAQARGRVRKAVSKLRALLREHDLDRDVTIVAEGGRSEPAYTMSCRRGVRRVVVRPQI